jgi:hypothetical protein
MPNNFMSEDSASGVLKSMAEKMNAEIQAYLIESGKNNVEFTLGGFSFRVEREDKE